jgi:hypothetical protein
MSQDNHKGESEINHTKKKKYEKNNFWYINKKKRNNISPNIKEKLNEKIKQLFHNLLSHHLGKKFYSKGNNNNSNINLIQIEEKITKGKYQSIFNFIKDLRNVLDYYFKIYAGYPTEFEEVFEFSDFCEKNVNNFLNETNNQKSDNFISKEEKEIIEKEILSLNQDQLQLFLNEFKDDFHWDIYSENFEIDIDIDKLDYNQFEKLKIFLKNCFENEKYDLNFKNYLDENTLSNSSK